MAIALARVRVPLAGLSVAFAVVGAFLGVAWWLWLGVLVVAAGLPMAFDSFDVDGETRSGVPGTAQPFMTR